MASTPAENFGLALQRALRRGDQTRIAKALGLSTSSINGYTKGVEPPPRIAVAIEHELDVPPGSLTIHLGYLSPNAATVDLTSPEQAIINDPDLEGRDKNLLLGMLSRMRGESSSR